MTLQALEEADSHPLETSLPSAVMYWLRYSSAILRRWSTETSSAVDVFKNIYM